MPKSSGSFKKGHKVPLEWRKIISQKNKGNRHSEETKRKIGLANKGREKSEETIKKMRKPKSEETKQKMRKPKSEEHKINISKGCKGIKFSEEHKINISNVKRGKSNLKHSIYMKLHNPSTTEEFKEKASIRMKGSGNHQWRGGLSFEPYDIKFNKSFKRTIRKRDNQICMLCGIHREKLKRALDVHHINYNKKLTILENCLSLCRNCHMKTGFNRKYWIKFFQSLLEERYDYQYENNLPIINLEVIK